MKGGDTPVEIEVTLDFQGHNIHFVEEDADYESFEEAIFQWKEGDRACDCARSRLLVKAGLLHWELPCRTGKKQQIKLVGLKPFVVH